MIRIRSEFSKLDMNKDIKITLTIYFASSLFLLLFVLELLVPTMEAKRINYFNFLSSLEYVGCNRALERMMPRIDMDKIENIILNTPGIDQAEKEFYTGILKARKENILDYSANQLSREKGAITLTKELKRAVDRSLAAKEISSTEAAKKYSEVQNSQSGKDEILNEPNVKAADDSHFEGSSDNACL